MGGMMAEGIGESRIRTEFLGIADLLRGRLRVPVYQRAFSWGVEQVQEFWDDLASALQSDEREYFLGTVVFTASDVPQERLIIDGQQRLAATAMLLASARDLYVKYGENKAATTVSSDFLASYDIKTKSEQPHLVLNSEDEHFFKQVVIERDPSTPPTRACSSHVRIEEAYRCLDRALSAAVSDAGRRWENLLVEWLEFLSKRARVIAVDVPSEADAFLIFETLNDRGLDLTIADMLKNYLFGLARKRIDPVRANWLAATSILEKSTDERVLIAFLRHYWSSEKGLVRERDLYKSIQSEVRSENQAVELSARLRAAAVLYDALLRVDAEFWASHGQSAKANVETLLSLGLEQYRPLMLSAMQHFTAKELERLTRALVAWSVRGLVVGGLGSGTWEKVYCDAARRIRAGEIKRAVEVHDLVAAILPTDERFESAFAAISPKTKLARYLLLAIERGYKNDKEPYYVPNSDANQLNLEHVLPQNAVPEDWPAFDQDELQQWSQRLGNMVLMTRSKNAKLGNKAYAVKQPALAAAGAHFTKSAAQYSVWTPEAVTERQSELATLAPRIWPSKP
jgi:hypothetical protein